MTSERRTGLTTSPVVGPCCQVEESLYSSVWASSKPASFNVLRISSAAWREPSLPVMRPPMVSARVSRNSMAPLDVKEWPTIREIFSSPTCRLEAAEESVCAETGTAANTSKITTVKRRITTSLTNGEHLNARITSARQNESWYSDCGHRQILRLVRVCSGLSADCR